MKKLIREFFFLRKGERWMLLAVSLVLVVSSLFRFTVLNKNTFISEVDPVYFQEMKIILDSITASVERQESFSKQKARDSYVLKLELFDPNTVSEEALLAMNLPGRIVSNILSYRKAGGIYESVQDMRRIYGMTDALFDSVQKYVRISPLQEGTKSIVAVEIRPPGTLMLDLNTADSLELCKLPGIGASYSRRIVRYRELLGGYYKSGQLLEVYGLDSNLLMGIEKYLIIDTLELRKINLNSATFGEMLSHPYLNRQMVMTIMDYREFAVEIQHVSELLDQHILEEESFRNIRPYLVCK